MDDYIKFNKFFFRTNTSTNIRVSLVAPDLCLDTLMKISNISSIDNNTQICAGSSEFVFQGFSRGVSGAPLITNGQSGGWDYTTTVKLPYLVGIRSFGVEGGFGLPTVYTKVSAFIPWIDSVIYSDRMEDATNMDNTDIAEDFESKLNFIY
jgi:secreted trypsin-like serine protease